MTKAAAVRYLRTETGAPIARISKLLDELQMEELMKATVEQLNREGYVKN